jgi:hypothetical protein
MFYQGPSGFELTQSILSPLIFREFFLGICGRQDRQVHWPMEEHGFENKFLNKAFFKQYRMIHT